MDRDIYLRHLAADGARMAELARTADLSARVPTCPDWDLKQLLEHTGMVHRWQTLVVRDRLEHEPWPLPPELSLQDGEDVADWFQRGVDEAVAVMGAVDPADQRWTWFPPDQTAGWYQRRVTQETLVHRVDAELAVGEQARTPMDPALSVDGIDEFVDVFIPAAEMEGQKIGGTGQTLHLHATDAEGEWLLTMHETRVEVQRGHAKGDAAVRGPAGELLLFAWGRDPSPSLEVFGDPSVVEAYTTAARL